MTRAMTGAVAAIALAIAASVSGCAAGVAAVASAYTAADRAFDRAQDVAGKIRDVVLKVRHLRERACAAEDEGVLAWARAKVRAMAEADGQDGDAIREKLCAGLTKPPAAA